MNTLGGNSSPRENLVPGVLGISQHYLRPTQNMGLGPPARTLCPVIPQAEPDRRRSVSVLPRAVESVNPVDIGPRAVSPVYYDSGALPREAVRHFPPFLRQQGSAECVTIERLWDLVPGNPWMCRQLVVNIMTHEMNRRTNAIRQMPGQFVIGAVHAAPGSKVATHQHVAAHLCPWASPRAAPANAPARNQ